MYVSVIHDLLLYNFNLELSGMASIATKSISDASIVYLHYHSDISLKSSY